MITFPINNVPWRIVTPPVYRFMAEQYVDEFFQTGRIRLSSFAAFALHSDEEREDRGEGVHAVLGRGTKATVYTFGAYGRNAFVLCGSQTNRSEVLTAFDANCGILIYDTTAFGLAISRYIPGLRFGIEGACTYGDGLLETNIGNLEIDLGPPGTTHDMTLLDHLTATSVGHAVFFRKRAHYEHQREYRWLWTTDAMDRTHIDLEVPDARQYCRKWNQGER